MVSCTYFACLFVQYFASLARTIYNRRHEKGEANEIWHDICSFFSINYFTISNRSTVIFGFQGNQKGLLTSLRKVIRGRTSPVNRSASMNSTRSAEEAEITDDGQMTAKKVITISEREF